MSAQHRIFEGADKGPEAKKMTFRTFVPFVCFVVNICLPTFAPSMALRETSSPDLHLSSVVIGCTPQMFRQYSRMERSEEKRPTRALLRIDMRVQFF